MIRNFKTWIGVLVIALAFVVFFSTRSKNVDNRFQEKNIESASKNRQRAEGSSRKSSGKRGEAIVNVQNKENDNEANTYIDLWSGLAKHYEGAALEAEKYRLLALAQNKLEGVMMGEFILFLANEANPEFLKQALLTAHTIVNQPHTEEALNWLVKLENSSLQARMMTSVGLSLTDQQVAHLMPQLKSMKAKENLLAGYCSAIASYDGLLAYQRFKSMKDPSMDYSGLVGVFLSAGKGTNFQAVSAELPNDAQGIAFEVRKALFNSWARHSPKDAAEYIVTASDLVSHIQLKRVVMEWAKGDKVNAMSWIDALPKGKHQDVSLLAISEGQMSSNPAAAWKTTQRIENSAIRKAAVEQVVREWRQYDPKAADKAYNEYLALFPPTSVDN